MRDHTRHGTYPPTARVTHAELPGAAWDAQSGEAHSHNRKHRVKRRGLVQERRRTSLRLWVFEDIFMLREQRRLAHNIIGAHVRGGIEMRHEEAASHRQEVSRAISYKVVGAGAEKLCELLPADQCGEGRAGHERWCARTHSENHCNTAQGARGGPATQSLWQGAQI